MKYLFVLSFFICLFFYGCVCSDIERLENDRELAKINFYKYFTIVNHTDKTYINNELFWLESAEIKKVWKLIYDSEDYVYSFTYDGKLYKYIGLFYKKINTINPNKLKINKNEKGNILKLGGRTSPPCYRSGYGRLNLFLLSLDGGKRKVFFGTSYGAGYVDKHWGEVSDCKEYVIKYDIHPVWQKKDLTITIEKNGKIKFSDPKIKEVKKLKLTINEKTEEVDPHALELVDCSKE